MNEDLQYQEYLSSGGTLPYGEYISAASLLSDIDSPDDDLKKKDLTTENGNQTLTSSTQPSQTELPTIPNPIPDNEFNVPLGSEQDLISPSSVITAEMPSTDLLLTDVVSSGLENSNPPIEGIAQQPTYTKPSVGAILYPIGNEEIGQYNERVAQRNRTITAKSDLSNASVQNGISEPLKQVKTSLSINTDINKESLIDEEGNKTYTEINGFTIPNALLPDPNDNYNILYDRDGNLNPWIKADKINLDELKPARFNEYTSSITDDVEGDNNNILQQSTLGNVEIKTENGEYAKDKDGKLVYKFTNKDYYDKTYVPYINEVNAQRKKKEDETNLDATYANRIISEKPNTELEDLYDEFESVFGRTPTDEEKLSVYNQETLLNFKANIEVERLKKLNPNADESVLRQQALEKFSNYTSSDINTGVNVLNLINESFQRDASNEGFLKADNNGRYQSTDKEEFDEWSNIAQNQAELGSFGKYWKEEGEAEFGSSWVKQRQITYQEKRFEIMGAYLDWKKRDSRILNEAKQNLIKQAKWNTRQAAESGDAERTQSVAEATANLLNDYGQFVNNLKEQENNDINTFSKFKREQDKFNARQDTKTDFINDEDKPAQYAANIVLGFASSVQSAVTGVARLASLPFGEGNFSDAVDVMGKPLSLGKYSSAPLSLNIKRYEGGVDEGGNKFEYREVNGDQYSYSNGKYTKLFGKIPEKAKLIDTETEYTAAGFLFQGSKMATDIMLTRGMGNVINKGIGAVSSKAFKFSRANALANTKNLSAVFGSESLLARGSASLYKASRNVNNASVTGWTVQMTEDSYQQGKKAGLEGKYLVGYTLFNSGLQSLIQRINPDVKFLKSIKTDHYNLMNALLSKQSDKALLYFNNIKGKVLNNASGETVEETTQQIVQDFTNLFTNSLTGSDLQFGTLNDYRDVLVSTPILSGALGASMGRNGKTTANIGGRNVDISSLTTAELETEVARNKGAEKFIKDYINTAYFDSVKERATEILNSIETRSKYISKIPKQEQYSTNTITQASVLLQQKSKLEKELNETDDAMKFLVEGDLEATKTKIRELFDNSEINTNFNSEIEKANAETAQPTPQSEAVQEQTTEAEQSQVTPQSEQPTVTGEQNVSAELNTTQDGQTTAEIESTESEVEEVGQGSQTEGNNATNQLSEVVEGNTESENVTQEITPEEEINEDEIVLSDDIFDLINSVEDDTQTTNNITVDGNTESSVSVIQQDEQGGQENTQTVSETVDVGGSQGNVEVNNNQYENNGKVYTKADNGYFLADNGRKVTNPKTITALQEKANARREETLVQTLEKNGYKYKKYSDGSEVLISTKGTEMLPTNKNGKPNANYRKAKVIIFGEKTENEIRIEDRARINEAVKNFIPTNPRDAVLQYFAGGGKVDKDYVSRKVAGNSVRLEARGKQKRSIEDYRWAWFTDKRPKTGEQIAEEISTGDFAQMNFDEQDLRNAVDDVIMTYNNVAEVKDDLLNLYNSDNDPYYGFTEADAVAMQEAEMSKQQIDFLNSIADINGNLTDAELLDYYKNQYENSINSLTNEQQDQLYQSGEPNSRTNPSPSNQNSGNESRVTEEQNPERSQSQKVDFLFYGERGAAQYANNEIENLVKARIYEEKGKTPKEILDATGWFKGTEGKWRKETDQKFTFTFPDFQLEDGDVKRMKLNEILNYPQLFKLYPRLEKVNLVFTNKNTNNYAETNGFNTITVYTDGRGISTPTGDKFAHTTGAIIHEIQHIIQGDERFASGYFEAITRELLSSRVSGSGMENPLSLSLAEYERVVEKGFGKEWRTEYNEGRITSKKIGDYLYENTAGEIEAFNAQRRSQLTEDQLRNEFPKLLNVNPDELIKSLSPIANFYFKKQFIPIPQATYDKLVKKLLGVFKKFGGKIITSKDDFNSKLKEFGYEGLDLQNISPIKSRQLEIINKTNPAPNNYNTWIRNEGDILTAEEAFKIAFEDGEMYPDFTVEDMQQALDSGFVNVYSSKPIKDGNFITPSKMNAESYAGNEKIYSERVKIGNIAWIDEGEGQFTRIEFMRTKYGEIYGAKFPDGTIYLNPEKINANTPIHEFSHLWQQLMPLRFKKGVEILKSTPIGKRTFAQLRENEGYANKTDDELWNEALVTVMGNEGERVFNSSKASKFKEWITDLFKVLGNAFGIRDLSPNEKLSTFVKGALSEVMGTKEIIPESSVEQKEVPIYIKKMSNTDLRGMLDKLGLVMDAVCP